MATKRCNVHSLACMRQINFVPADQVIVIPKRTFDLYLVSYCIDNNLQYIEDGDIVRIKTNEDGFALCRDGNALNNVNADTLVDVHIGRYESEVWFPLLQGNEESKKLTFASEFVQLDTSHMELLLHFYDRTEDANRLKSSDTYRNLVSLLDNCFASFSAKGISKIFVKLNSVSPKDICYYDDDPMGDINALAAYRSEHVIHMLTRSSRCMSVIKRTLHLRLPNPVLIMLREFVEMPFQNEFRCFVYDGKLRAISQYHWMIHDKSIVDNQLAIRDRIDTFYRLSKQYIPYKDCVMDVILLDDESKFEGTFMNLGIYLIEFNCFGGDLVAGSALYHWYHDYDILYKNSNLADIRVCVVEPHTEHL
uniref:Cdc123 n=1 Tax=Clandestinovirus TaxID=2831644 RepID=A0A8F8PNI1_9VIRU|nr:Cdc123 [Clandestinovirus]